MGGANQSISAGLGGFLAFFVLAVALWFLMQNMLGRLRRVRFEEEVEDARLAAEAEATGGRAPRRRQIFLPVDDSAGAATGPAAPLREAPAAEGHVSSDRPRPEPA